MSSKGWEHKRALIIAVVRETALFQFSIILSGDQNTVMISVIIQKETRPVIYIHFENVRNNYLKSSGSWILMARATELYISWHNDN